MRFPIDRGPTDPVPAEPRPSNLTSVRRRLLETRDAVDLIATEAGFEDAEALDQCFRSAYFISPQDYRALLGAGRFQLELPDWLLQENLLTYWGRDPSSLSEKVQGRRISWSTLSPVGPLRVDAEMGVDRAEITVHTADEQNRADPLTAGHAHELVIRWLGLHLDPRDFERRVARESDARLIHGRHGLTLPQTGSCFDAALWVVAGQQVSLAAAFSIRRRLTERFGTPAAGLICSPSAQTIAEAEVDELFRHGLTRRKSEYLSGIAAMAQPPSTETASESLPTTEPAKADLEHWRSLPEAEAEAHLLAIRGFGAWSVNYLLMRALGFADRVPLGDAALARALQRFYDLPARPNREQTMELMAPFAPHRSLASFHFWATLADPD